MDINKKSRLALEYYRSGDLRRAEALFRDIIRARPRNFEAYYHLAGLLQDMGRDEEAVDFYRRAIRINPRFPGTYYNLGFLFKGRGDPDEALACFQKALEFDPSSADICNAIGVIYQSTGRLDDARAYFRKALEHDPASAMAYYNLGNVLFRMDAVDEAVESYQKALRLRPDYARVYCNLGLALQEKGQLDDAVAHYRKALQLDPNLAEAANNLGRVFQARGMLEEAEAHYRRAMQIRPGDPVPYQNLIFLMLYDTRHEARKVFSEHLEFARLFEGPFLSGIRPHTNDRTVGRRIRIGYVSPDFRRHSVAFFIEPVISSHDREHFEVSCYSSVSHEDEVTERIRREADHWRDIGGASDEEASELIRSDGIDILVDLAGHTSNNRLLLFARKPAPVQVSWIGYPATTGLSTVDYKIVDGQTDPPGMTEALYTEELIRMPGHFLCYLPESDGPELARLPATDSGRVTFGSFNNFAKVSAESFRLWSAVLRRVPGARMVLKAKSLSDASAREYAIEMFGRNGIAADRLELLPQDASFEEHLNRYNQIDIALDTFPYNGTTTTCEALWMGVPVVTLAGSTHASRVGASLLSAVGLSELVAGGEDEYGNAAAGLASDPEKLQALRQGLRDRVRRSPLTDARRFTHDLEDRYRDIWRRWSSSR